MTARLFLLYPLAEIAAFILVGRAIGLLPTLGLVVASSLIGVTMLREAGLVTAVRLERGRDTPARVLAEGGTRMLAGLLLLVPGFLTDLAAIALLIPGVGRALASRLAPGGAPDRAARQVIEGEFRRLDE